METMEHATPQSPGATEWLLHLLIAALAAAALVLIVLLWALAAALGQLRGRRCSPAWRWLAASLWSATTSNGRHAVDGSNRWWADPVRRARRACAAERAVDRLEDLVTFGASRRAAEEMAAFAAEHEAQLAEIRERLAALAEQEKRP